jgi:chaperonin GroEL (HSP60 family)
MDYNDAIKAAVTTATTLVLAYFGYVRKRLGTVDKVSKSVHGDENSEGLVKTVKGITTSLNGTGASDGVLKELKDIIEEFEKLTKKVGEHDEYLNGSGVYDGAMKRLKELEDHLEECLARAATVEAFGKTLDSIQRQLDEIKRTSTKDTQDLIKEALKPIWTVMEKKIGKDLADIQFKHMMTELEKIGRAR